MMLQKPSRTPVRLPRFLARGRPRGRRLPDTTVRPLFTSRTRWIAAMVWLGYAGLSAKAFGLMILPDEKLATKAQVQFEQSIELRGTRGDLLARDGSILATTVDLFTVHANPSRLRLPVDTPTLDPARLENLAQTLSELLGIDQQELLERLNRPTRKDVVLARGLTYMEAEAIRDATSGSVIWTESDPRRFYPGRGDAGQLIGITSRAGPGAAGVELMQDRTLRGQIYKFVQMRDRKGRRV
ncbi:MAG: hypothetical protein QGG40_08860, partial [Myxococcota bacterium]|nr:hypothetical protein [Myxococcota bacterium]